MNTETKPEAQVQDEAKAQQNLMDPYEFLARIPGAPSKAAVEALKTQAPNQTIRILALGSAGKRVYLVRGVSGLELKQVQSQIPENLGAGLTPEARAARIEEEVAVLTASKAVVWTNTTTTGKLTDADLRAGAAGLPSTLFNLVSYLSDFIEPDALQVISADL